MESLTLTLIIIGGLYVVPIVVIKLDKTISGCWFTFKEEKSNQLLP